MTDDCCEGESSSALDRIRAGLDSLPRQTQTFPDVRQSLLAAIPTKPALGAWRARSGDDLGLMWLEMWAYIADVLGFYDARIANETYLRTAQLRPSLRRIVELLGYVPAPGVAGQAWLAAISDRREVRIPARAGFRSSAFENQAPQVFEIEHEVTVHELANSWEIGPVSTGVVARDIRA